LRERIQRERIQKVLARAGAGSRRQIEAWIREGRIAVNGAPAHIGESIGPHDRVTLDGRPLRVREPDSDTRVVLYHRSARRTPEEGEVEEPIDLGARLPKRAGRRWISISPLPPNDGGLEILTSDGELAQALMRKVSSLRIEFAVRIRGEPTLGQLELLKGGALEDRKLEIESVIPGGGEGYNRWVKLITRGARARDIHRLFAAAGLQMSRLMRVAIGPLHMDRSLGRERTDALSPAEAGDLYALAGLPRPMGRRDDGHDDKGRGDRRDDKGRGVAPRGGKTARSQRQQRSDSRPARKEGATGVRSGVRSGARPQAKHPSRPAAPRHKRGATARGRR